MFEASSSSFLLAILIIGLPLALLRPYSAFLLGVFVLSALAPGELAQVRTILGPYFNALDACLVVAIMAAVVDGLRRGRLVVPGVLAVMILVLSIATVQTAWKLGFTYETLRALRWALTFPLWYFVASNMVVDSVRVKALVITLFVGTILVDLRGLLLVSSRLELYVSAENYAVIRNSRLMGVSVYILPAMIVWILPHRWWQKIVYLGVGAIFALTIVSSQTRSSWIAVPVTVSVLWWLLGRRSRDSWLRLFKIMIVVGVVTALVLVVFRFAFPGLDPFNLVVNRMNELTNPGGSSLSRRLALNYELQSWLESPIILGQGLSYFQAYIGSGIAVNHLGYLTYLAQLGILGFLVYAVYVPISVVRDSIKVFTHTRGWFLGFFATLSTACMVYLAAVFFMSGSLLSHAPIPGILAGGIWALSKQLSKAEQARADVSDQGQIGSHDTLLVHATASSEWR